MDISLGDAFPICCGPHRRLVPDGDGCETVDREHTMSMTPTFSHLMPFGFVVPGNLHILDSVMQSVTSSLAFWPSVKHQVKAVSHFLHEDSTRHRLQERCCVGRFACFSVLFNKAICPKYIEHRWEVVARCTKGILRAKVFRMLWNVRNIRALPAPTTGAEATGRSW